jgi:hypothetical protein
MSIVPGIDTLTPRIVRFGIRKSMSVISVVLAELRQYSSAEDWV